MIEIPRRSVDDSHWYITNPDGTATWLPKCSSDYTPSHPRWNTCLLDPGGPICRQHRTFFKNREVANVSNRHRSAQPDADDDSAV